MREDFLHYLWRWQRFDLSNLTTTAGQPIQIVKTGILNTHAGPDFLNAKVRIGETLWAGNIEIHINASDWIKHQHQQDRAYDTVILHVVLDEDMAITYPNGAPIPTLSLRKRVPTNVASMYLKFLNNEHWIPCQHQFHTVKDITKNLWLERLMIERLEQKTQSIQQALTQNQNDWEGTFYYFLARGFGLKINTTPFEMLARSLPLSILAKHRNHLFQLEALFFGQAGMLSTPYQDAYPNRLKREYAFLQKKYDLTPIRSESWKFLRLRPPSFPTIRIAQLAKLIHQSTHLFANLTSVQSLQEVYSLLDVSVGNYWENHYVFDKESIKRKKAFGKSSGDLLIINVIAPFLFLYGQYQQNEQYKDQAISLLEAVSSERNSIIQQWEVLGVKAQNACQSQALLQLKNEYCQKKRCLQCAIGNQIIGVSR